MTDGKLYSKIYGTDQGNTLVLPTNYVGKKNLKYLAYL